MPIRLSGLLGNIGLSLALVGCASISPPVPVSVVDVIRLSQAGTPSEEIIRRMRHADMVYRLKASQFARLHQQGVADNVLDYMQTTYLNAVRRDQYMENWNRGWAGPDGYFYGGCFFGGGPYGCR